MILATSGLLTIAPAGHGIDYAWRSPLPQGNGLNGIDVLGDVLVAVGDRGTTVVSSDGGDIWVDLSNFEALDVTFHDVVIVDASTFVSVGTDAFIYRSVDAGASWTPIANPATFQLNDVETIPGGALSAIGNDGQILRSIDQGLTWTLETIPPAIFEARAQHWFTDQHGIVVGQLFAKETLNGGQTWTDLPSVADDPASSGTIRDAHFLDATHGVIVADFDTWYTTDAGTSWTHQSAFELSYQQRVWMRGPTNWFVTTGTEGATIYETTDAGTTWTRHVGQFSVRGFFDLAVDAAGRFHIVSTAGDHWQSTPDGQTWINTTTTPSGNDRVSLVSLQLFSSDRGYAAGTAAGEAIASTGTVYCTDDGGTTWATTSSSPGLADIHSLVVLDDEVLLVAGDGPSESVFKSTDGGATWIEHALDVQSFLVTALTAADASNLFGAAVTMFDSRLLRSEDGGITWNYITPIVNSEGIIDALTFVDGSIGYLGGYNGVDPQLWRTTDGGDTWVIVAGAGLPSAPISHMEWIDVDTGFAGVTIGASAGIYRTTDAGNSWSAVSMTATTVFDIAGSRGIASGFNQSQYQITEDGGLTWTPIGVPWTRPAFGTMVTAGGYLIAGASSVILELDPEPVVAVHDEPNRPHAPGLSVTPVGAISARPSFDLTLARHATVHAAIFDAGSRRVRALLAGPLAAGTTKMEWDGLTDSGDAAASGVYFAIVRAGEQRVRVRLVKID